MIIFYITQRGGMDERQTNERIHLYYDLYSGRNGWSQRGGIITPDRTTK